MILCCGEALIDMIPKPTNTGAMGFVPHDGGASLNTSVALGRLGVQVGLLSGVSTDIFGQQIAASLNASHVNASHLIRSDRPTTLAFVQLTNGSSAYTFMDENSAGRMIATSDLPEISDEVNAALFGGISLCLEPAAATYQTLQAKLAKKHVVMLDPNIRPKSIGDVVVYRNRLEAMIGLSDIVKVSDEDLNWLYPGSESLASKLQKIRAAGPVVVILTRGGDGASAFLSDGTEVQAGIEKVKVVDTVGAGDTFNAGFLAKLSEMGLLSKDALRSTSGEDIQTALKFAAKVAAVTVSRAGANPPWRHELT